MSIKHEGGDETEGRVRLDWSFGLVWCGLRLCVPATVAKGNSKALMN